MVYLDIKSDRFKNAKIGGVNGNIGQLISAVRSNRKAQFWDRKALKAELSCPTWLYSKKFGN
jgi:hypothetical protein